MEAIWSSVNKTKVNFSFARGMAFIDHVVSKKKDVEYHGNVYVYSPYGIDMQPPHQANLFPQHSYLLDIHTWLMARRFQSLPHLTHSIYTIEMIKCPTGWQFITKKYSYTDYCW